jgi:hypothetical protein
MKKKNPRIDAIVRDIDPSTIEDPKDTTEIVVIIDKSGSMCHLVDDTIGGFNSFIEEQRALPGHANLTLVLFNQQYELIEMGENIQDIKLLSRDTYYPSGYTALLDAVGRAINETGQRLANITEEDKPGKVIVVIITDGQENCSREFEKQQIKDMITHQQEKYSWQFVYLGANQDAFAEAGELGISGLNTVDYTASSIGTQSVYRGVSDLAKGVRDQGVIPTTWKGEIK